MVPINWSIYLILIILSSAVANASLVAAKLSYFRNSQGLLEFGEKENYPHALDCTEDDDNIPRLDIYRNLYKVCAGQRGYGIALGFSQKPNAEDSLEEFRGKLKVAGITLDIDDNAPTYTPYGDFSFVPNVAYTDLNVRSYQNGIVELDFTGFMDNLIFTFTHLRRCSVADAPTPKNCYGKLPILESFKFTYRGQVIASQRSEN